MDMDDFAKHAADGIKRTIRFIMDRQPELSADEAALVMQAYVDEEVKRIKELAEASRWQPAGGVRPICVGRWQDERARAGCVPPPRCSMRLRAGEPDGIDITVALCDVAAWDEARDKDRVGTLSLDRSQATHLRDALSSMLARTSSVMEWSTPEPIDYSCPGLHCVCSGCLVEYSAQRKAAAVTAPDEAKKQVDAIAEAMRKRFQRHYVAGIPTATSTILATLAYELGARVR